MPQQVQDLTIREIEEAKSWGFDAERWLKIKAHFRERIQSEIEPEIYKNAQERAETELREAVREELVQQLTEQYEDNEITPGDRAAFVRFVRGLELECMALARVASEMGTATNQRHAKYQTIGWWLLLTMLSLCAPVAYAIDRYGHNPTPLTFSAYLAPMVVLGLFGLSLARATLPTIRESVGYASVDRSLDNHFKHVASKYLVVAEACKRRRMIDTTTISTKDKLRASAEEIQGHKRLLDENFSPSTELLTKARQMVREQIVEDMDTNDLLRVETPQAKSKKLAPLNDDAVDSVVLGDALKART